MQALADNSPAYEQLRAERQRQEEARQHQEEIRRHQAEARQRQQEEDRRKAVKIDAILDKYEHELKDYYSSRPGNSALDINAAILRLKSKNPGALRAVLKHSAHLANKVDFRKAISEFLRRPEIDNACAEIIASLPFDDMTRKLIAMDSAGNAENFPAGLIISLVGNDADVIESFLMHIKPEDYAAVLRRWPAGKIMNPNITRKLLESNDARILVPLLSLISSNFPQTASHYRKRLIDLGAHPTAAVRAWAKKLV